MSILGLDIGTTGTKAVAFDLDGRVLASAYEEYNLHSPAPGHLELDPQEVLGAIRKTIGQVAQATRGDPIRSVATSSLGEAAFPVDEANRPVGNAIIGFDARGQKEAEALRGNIGNEEVFAITGHGINSYHTLFKILWRRANTPDVFRRSRRYLCPGDFFAASLGLAPAIDYSIASRTLAFDIHRLQWSERILSAAGLPTDIFAPPAAPGTVVGTVGDNNLGLPKGCVVAAGLHDQPAGVVGAGIHPGESMYATGTVVCLGVRLECEPDPGPLLENNLCYYPTYGKEQYVSLAWNFTGGSLLKWYRDILGDPERAEAERRGVDPYDVICSDLPPGPTALLVLPHFTMTGTPWLDPKARGAILGLTLTTGRKELVKAILEGVTYEIKLNTAILASAGVEIRHFKAIGGAAKSEVWMQISADILGQPVSKLAATEGASLGMALLGAKAAGLIDSVEEAAERFARIERTFEPDPETTKAYEERFQIYREIYPSTKALSHRIDGLTS